MCILMAKFFNQADSEFVNYGTRESFSKRFTVGEVSFRETEFVEATGRGASRDHDPMPDNLRKNSLEP